MVKTQPNNQSTEPKTPDVNTLILEVNLGRSIKPRFWYGGNPYYTDSYHNNAKAANKRRRELREQGLLTRLKITYRFEGMVTVPQTSEGKTWHLFVAKKRSS